MELAEEQAEEEETQAELGAVRGALASNCRCLQTFVAYYPRRTNVYIFPYFHMVAADARHPSDMSLLVLAGTGGWGVAIVITSQINAFLSTWSRIPVQLVTHLLI